jgi:hypothetical protein
MIVLGGFVVCRVGCCVVAVLVEGPLFCFLGYFAFAWVAFIVSDVWVFVTLLDPLMCSWRVCLMCKGGCKYFVRRSDVLSCVSTPPILISLLMNGVVSDVD